MLESSINRFPIRFQNKRITTQWCLFVLPAHGLELAWPWRSNECQFPEYCRLSDGQKNKEEIMKKGVRPLSVRHASEILIKQIKEADTWRSVLLRKGFWIAAMFALTGAFAVFRCPIPRNECIKCSFFPNYMQVHGRTETEVNHRPIDQHYKWHESTNRSHVPQLSKATIPTSKLKYIPNPMQA